MFPPPDLCPLCTNTRSCLQLPHRCVSEHVCVPYAPQHTDGHATTPGHSHGPMSTLMIPTGLCPHGQGGASHEHMHTHARTLTDTLMCWCGYTLTHPSVGSLSDSCPAGALLDICQVVLQAGENDGSGGRVRLQRGEVSLFSLFGARLLKCHE